MDQRRPAPPRKPGRPRSFDADAALRPAMLLFWQHGYEATSLASLTRAMGLTPPSLYAAYGDKKGLFRAALRRYLADPQTPVELIAQAPTAADAARTLVMGAATAFTGKDTPAGCLLASAAIAVSPDAEDLRQELAAIRADIETALRTKIEADIAAGLLPPATHPATLAAYTLAIIQGLSTLARDGAPRPKLQQVARFALSSWPTS